MEHSRRNQLLSGSSKRGIIAFSSLKYFAGNDVNLQLSLRLQEPVPVKIHILPEL